MLLLGEELTLQVLNTAENPPDKKQPGSSNTELDKFVASLPLSPQWSWILNTTDKERASALVSRFSRRKKRGEVIIAVRLTADQPGVWIQRCK